MQRRVKILIVDDDEAVSEYAKFVLTRAGYHVFTAANAEQGRDAFRRVHPDLVLVDIVMPGQSGLSLVRRLSDDRERDQFFSRIVMLTAQKSREDVTTAVVYGAHDYVAKPIQPQRLLEKIERQLQELETERVLVG